MGTDFKSISTLGQNLLLYFSQLWNTLNTSVNNIAEDSEKPIIKFIRSILMSFGNSEKNLADYTIIELMLGVGLSLFVIVVIVKWIRSMF